MEEREKEVHELREKLQKEKSYSKREQELHQKEKEAQQQQIHQAVHHV